ncbi:Crp/Fnr family transcriptional regulator, partial [Baileyella intestinalis]
NRTFLLSSKSVRDKILAYLNNVRLQKGANEFDIPFDRQQLADFLNIERTALSKELSRMKSEGLIEYRKNHFVLLSTEDM